MKYLLQLLIGCSFLLLQACQNQDAHYYRTHPQALQEALKRCPQASSPQINCASLELIALDVNKLVYELQQNAQEFGQKIMALQDEKMTIKQSLGADNTKADELVKQKLKGIEDELALRLSVVKWLESPES